eukprot:2687032-Prymnesium_polylepis.1
MVSRNCTRFKRAARQPTHLCVYSSCTDTGSCSRTRQGDQRKRHDSVKRHRCSVRRQCGRGSCSWHGGSRVWKEVATVRYIALNNAHSASSGPRRAGCRLCSEP